jgi:hypothetical protein
MEHLTPLKYIWIFSVVLIFIQIYNFSKVLQVQMYFSDVSVYFAF